jgi:hypothetical protein
MYGGGRVLRPGDPDGALPTVEEVRLPAGRADEIYRTAHAAGLNRDATYTDSPRTDAALLVTTLNSGGRMNVVRAPAGSARQVEKFRDSLPSDLGPAVAYRPRRIAAVAWASDPSRRGPDVRPWPFAPFRAGTKIREGLCVLLGEREVASVSQLARQAASGAAWRSDGVPYSVAFRPLLPDERDCADLDS